jgi:hypothetical protein
MESAGLGARATAGLETGATVGGEASADVKTGATADGNDAPLPRVYNQYRWPTPSI